MINESTGMLMSFPYRWGIFENNKWNEKGKLVITSAGVLMDNEKLVNTRYHAISRSLVFGGDHGSFARTGRFAFDNTQLYFHGTMELDDGGHAHIIGFADFDVTYITNIKPVNYPDAPGKEGPTLQISINPTAFDKPASNTAIKFILTLNKNAVDVSNRVTSSNLNVVNQTFEINMGPGGPFPPTEDLFDIIMATDMSGFSGTYQLDNTHLMPAGQQANGSGYRYILDQVISCQLSVSPTPFLKLEMPESNGSKIIAGSMALQVPVLVYGTKAVYLKDTSGKDVALVNYDVRRLSQAPAALEATSKNGWDPGKKFLYAVSLGQSMAESIAGAMSNYQTVLNRKPQLFFDDGR